MKKFVSWNAVESFVNKMVEEYKGENISGVYGLPRGGLVMAVMLSHRLKVPMLNSPAPNCIIVDDICDSGESLLHYVNQSSSDAEIDYHIITMYYKENTLGVIPERYAEVKGEDWIVFPWEEARPEGGIFGCTM